MKKIIAGIILILAFQITIGQTYTGFTAGVNIANLQSDSLALPNRAPRYGVYAGLTWDIYLNLSTYIQVSLIYSQQGANPYKDYYSEGYLNRYMIRYQVDYIQVPVVWKQRWSGIYTELGGYLSVAPYAPKAKWYLYTFYRDTTVIASDDYRSFTNSVRIYDVGAIFGLGYQFKLSSQFDAYLNFSYRLGLIKLNKWDVIPAYRMNNQVFTFNVGLISIGRAYRHNRYLFKRRKRL